jgi:hypothetical protein
VLRLLSSWVRVPFPASHAHNWVSTSDSRSDVDPYSFNPDTDSEPAFQVNLDPDPDSGFDYQKLKKKYSRHFVFFF